MAALLLIPVQPAYPRPTGRLPTPGPILSGGVPLPPVRPPDSAAVLPGGSQAGDRAAPAPLPPSRPVELGPVRPVPAQPPAPPPGGAPAPAPQIAEPARPAWTAPGSAIHDPPTPMIPGAFPVDQMDAACTRVLAGGKIVGRREPSILGPDGCGIAYPVSLQAVVLADGQQVALTPAPVLRCDLADRLADWLRDDLASLGAARGRLVAVTNGTAYQCRGRNNVPGAAMSEHGRGDAIDILSLRFAKQEVGLRQADAHDLWAKVKTSACSRFMTVLGPGSDGYHENNLHLDLESRRNGSHYCHWDDP